MVVLVGVSLSALHFALPISIAIAAVLGIVVVSYTQTVQAYQTSGGAYVVAKDNLGTLPSLVAAAALLVDYVLTVAVSVTAGVLALTSALPSLGPHKVGLSLAFVALLTLVNLRGVRESGVLFALPTYGFVAVMFAMVGDGRGEVRGRDVPSGDGPRSARRRCRRRRHLRAPPGVRLGIGRTDRSRGDLERRRSVPEAEGSKRRADDGRDGRDRDLALPRRLVSRGVDERGAELERVGDLRDRARDVPDIVLLDRFPLLRGTGADVRHPRPRGQHLVPGLPAPGSGARAGPVLPAPVREPRRPARLLERDRRPRWNRCRSSSGSSTRTSSRSSTCT